jgi:hypothetical protein
MISMLHCVQTKSSEDQQKRRANSIVYSEEEASDLSDKVVPVSKPEAAGWSLVIIGAYSITAFLIYLVYTQVLVEGPEEKVFNKALEAVRQDFRVTALLGDTIKGAYISLHYVFVRVIFCFFSVPSLGTFVCTAWHCLLAKTEEIDM